MDKIKKWLSPVIFCSFVFLITAVLLIMPDRAYSEREKRYLQNAPHISLSGIMDGTFQDDLEAWIADQFPGRDLWVGIHSYTNLLTGRNAQQDIYHAKDGYLISAPASNDLAIFETTLARFDSFVEKTGFPASLVMIPATGWFHEDKLPVGHKEYPDDSMFRMAEDFAAHLNVYDLRDSLRSADTTAPVSYLTDHHLTSYGNYTLYSALRSAQGKSFLSTADYDIERYDGFYGTAWSGSGYWLTKPDAVELWDSGAEVSVTISDGLDEDICADSMFFLSHLEELDKYPVFLDGNHALTTITNPDAQDGTLLIIKDSYAHGFAPFMADHYKTIYLLDLRYYRGKVSEFAAEQGVDELLFLYGTSTLLTDTNSAWLF